MKLHNMLIYLLLLAGIVGCSPVTEETTPSETYTILETESYMYDNIMIEIKQQDDHVVFPANDDTTLQEQDHIYHAWGARLPDGKEPYQNVKQNLGRRLPVYATPVQNFKDIYKYMNLLIDYFNTPYEIGDPLDSHNVLYLCAALCACCEEGEPAFVSFSVSEDYIMTISKAELDVLAGHLFGESVDLTKYHNTFSGKFDTFNTVSEVYTFSTATDYWQGDGYYYLRDDMVVQEDEKFLSFEMTIQNTGYLVDSSVQPVQKRMRYLFEKKVFDGLVYPQLIKIAECP